MLTATALAVLAFGIALLAGYLLGARRGRDVRFAQKERIAKLAARIFKTEEMEQTAQRAQWQTEIKEMLEPLNSEVRLKRSLTGLDVGSGTRTELPRLLDTIAVQGGFDSCQLTDEAGLPVAASSGTVDAEFAAGLAALVPQLIDRIADTGESAPISLSIHDQSDRYLLYRTLQVRGERYLLTALSRGQPISHNALDTVLMHIEVLLINEAWNE